MGRKSTKSLPARAIGRGGDLGSLAPGYTADAVLLSADLCVVHAVWTAGVQNLAA